MFTLDTTVWVKRLSWIEKSDVLKKKEHEILCHSQSSCNFVKLYKIMKIIVYLEFMLALKSAKTKESDVLFKKKKFHYKMKHWQWEMALRCKCILQNTFQRKKAYFSSHACIYTVRQLTWTSESVFYMIFWSTSGPKEPIAEKTPIL